jgi:hypothetical protein
MDAFMRELMRRSPLAASVLEACDYMFDDRLLAAIWEQGRGRCYEDTLTFDAMLRLMRDALIRHGGSAHQLFVELESDNKNPVDESNFYRKLSRTPTEVSRGLLRGCTQRLAMLMPETSQTLPRCFDGFELIVADGKKIKNATKRLKPARGYQGALLGATALVALNLRNGMAIAFGDSLDGMSNDVPLVGELMPQLHELFPDRPILTIWDRQFDDLRTFGRLSARPQDAWIVRLAQKQVPFIAEESVKTVDSLGRTVLDEIGVLGKENKALRVRRVTLFRDNAAGEENIVLQSNLLVSPALGHRAGVPAGDSDVLAGASDRVQPQGDAAAVFLLPAFVQPDAVDPRLGGRHRPGAGPHGLAVLSVQRLPQGAGGLGLPHRRALAPNVPHRRPDATAAGSVARRYLGPHSIHQERRQETASQTQTETTPAWRL